jgi:hypothetical protein
MPWVGEQLLRRAGLHDLSRVHHRDPIGVSGDDAEVVGHQDHRHTEAVAQFIDEFEDLFLDGRIECRCRFVGDQQFRFTRQRHRNHYALPHPARQQVGVGIQPFLGTRQPDQIEHLRGAFSRLCPGHVAVQQNCLRHLVTNGHARVQ